MGPEVLPFLLCWAGVWILLKRIVYTPLTIPDLPNLKSPPLISIIVPARNEEKNLPTLLSSLQKLDYPSYEVLVVDDHSTDRTEQISKKFPVIYLKGDPLPEGWNGKNWVCAQAACVAKGDYFLFTDADTKHNPMILKKALAYFLEHRGDLMSALPYHENPTWWERGLGPFHALILMATNFSKPRPRRMYAVGQFLFFSRSFYEKCGGHKAVYSEYPDDLALANLCYRRGGKFLMYLGAPLFQVRLYATFLEFVQGWRRNFSAGIQQSHWRSFLDVVLVIIAMLGAGRFWHSAVFLLPMAICVVLIGLKQQDWGRFSFWGPILFPFSLLIYSGVTLLAIFDYVRGNRLVWKGRVLKSWRTQAE